MRSMIFALQVRVFAISLLDALPNAAPVCAYMGKQHVAVSLLVQPLDLDGLAFAELDRGPGIQKLLRRNQPFEFPADIYNHARFSYREHAPIENLAFGNRRLGRRELLE